MFNKWYQDMFTRRIANQLIRASTIHPRQIQHRFTNTSGSGSDDTNNYGPSFMMMWCGAFGCLFSAGAIATINNKHNENKNDRRISDLTSQKTILSRDELYRSLYNIPGGRWYTILDEAGSITMLDIPRDKSDISVINISKKPCPVYFGANSIPDNVENIYIKNVSTITSDSDLATNKNVERSRQLIIDVNYKHEIPHISKSVSDTFDKITFKYIGPKDISTHRKYSLIEDIESRSTKDMLIRELMELATHCRVSMAFENIVYANAFRNLIIRYFCVRYWYTSTKAIVPDISIRTVDGKTMYVVDIEPCKQ